MKAPFYLTLIIQLLCQSIVNTSYAAEKNAETPDVLDLNIEDLVNVKVTSVSKKAQALSDAPAAIFVISHDDIKRSGVTSVPEALRMAPGIEVARINANKWAISARGFNGSIANKLLVLIDGRSVYTPAFSGVYWDSQDVMLEDVERIEVIRGPGATLWGANAVNGVINIISKRSEDTQGGLLSAGGGSKETGFGAFRYGTKLGKDTTARAYAKGFQRDEFKTPQGLNAGDDWNKQQGGFRMDSQLSSKDDLTVQGDIYQGSQHQSIVVPTVAAPHHQPINDTINISGGNIVSRLHHSFSTTSEYSLQLYFDHYSRQEYIEAEQRDTFDVDFQHNFAWGNRQNLIWGLDYRMTHDNFKDTQMTKLLPSSRGTQLFSGFIQDEIMLIEDKLWFTIGSKFEHNDYTGFEGQPTARIMWAPKAGHRLWGAISRSVRTPARAEHDVSIYQRSELVTDPRTTSPISVNVTMNGNKNYVSEEELAFELGYRFTLANKASLDLTAFYNDYNNLSSAQRGNSTYTLGLSEVTVFQNFSFANQGKGHTYGIEAAGVWQMNDWWRWDINYSFLQTKFEPRADSQHAISPTHKASIRAGINPIQNVTMDFWLRYTGSALAISPSKQTEQKIDGYTTMDVRFGWQVHPAVELSITGQNLLDNQHTEYLEETFVIPTKIPRGVYGQITWQF
jgi:iron complex outermembrane receptor protein